VTSLRCADAEASFVEVMDGRLDPASSVRVHAHIESCDGCRARAALWAGLLPALRALAPEPPGAMDARRMQLEIERQLAGEPAAAPRRWRWTWATAALGLAGAAAVVALQVRAHVQPAPSTVAVLATAPSYATLASATGALTIDGRPAAAATAVPAGAAVALPSGSAELSLARGTALRIDGPARLSLTGSATAVAVRLDTGLVTAAVAHRLPTETFAVVTRDLRVEVRGTRFSVSASATGSRVVVEEGQVAVNFPDGRTELVSTGESLDSSVPEAPGLEPPAPTIGQRPAPSLTAAPRLPTCASAVRSCKETTSLARASMRAGEPARAVQILAGRHAGAEVDSRCGDEGLAACQDDLGYLHAEALNQAGKPADAVAAYHALDRRGAPAAMRQNALYAAAQIERRRGQNGDARADYERALEAAPRGALREEALVGAMESAEAAGNAPRARALARRYLAEFPHGLGAATAARLTGRP
jgi:ferric-dicitrate binding protein FerR (iron transport regulator)